MLPDVRAIDEDKIVIEKYNNNLDKYAAIQEKKISKTIDLEKIEDGSFCELKLD